MGYHFRSRSPESRNARLSRTLGISQFLQVATPENGDATAATQRDTKVVTPPNGDAAASTQPQLDANATSLGQACRRVFRTGTLRISTPSTPPDTPPNPNSPSLHICASTPENSTRS